MTGPAVVVIVLALVAVVALVAWMVFGRRHPEHAASHTAPGRNVSGTTAGDHTGRPARPGAEAQAVVGPGEIAPGPPNGDV